MGHTNECDVCINGKLFTSLLDTGANVSTICSSAFRNTFPDGVIRPIADFNLVIECAGDHTLPYSGYANVDVDIPGVVGPVNCLLLITPDTRYGEKVPVNQLYSVLMYCCH